MSQQAVRIGTIGIRRSLMLSQKSVSQWQCHFFVASLAEMALDDIYLNTAVEI
jgi:hypothetical protein